jgi:hypothetical protein
MVYSDTHFPALDMPTVLRLTYSRFAVQEILSNKLEESEAGSEGRALGPVDREYLPAEPEAGVHASTTTRLIT